jgi:serine/threonine-protein kinase
MSSERLIGVVLADRYLPRGVLGSGSNADVLFATDMRTGGVVALKVLQEQHRGAPGPEARIVREGRISGRLRHPNVCGLLDVAKLPDGSTFLVMEALSGESLEQRLARVGPLPVDEAIDILYQLLSGLGAAHASGFVHRDLKPANVFLVPLGPRSTVVKVLDFGGAVAVDGDAPDAAQLTAAGLVVGTPLYMTPEQVLGRRDFDGRTDLYVCGTILYEALTGARPFPIEELAPLMEAIAYSRPRPASELRPELPPELVAVIDKATERERPARFQTAYDFQSALLDALDAWESRVGAPSRARKEAPRSERAWGSGGTVRLGDSQAPRRAPDPDFDDDDERWNAPTQVPGLRGPKR